MQLRYLLELFLEAECLDWAMMICLVLRDSETVARLINRFTDKVFVAERQIKRLAAIILAIDRWSAEECPGYRAFFYKIKQDSHQLDEALKLPGIPNLYAYANMPKKSPGAREQELPYHGLSGPISGVGGAQPQQPQPCYNHAAHHVTQQRAATVQQQYGQATAPILGHSTSSDQLAMELSKSPGKMKHSQSSSKLQQRSQSVMVTKLDSMSLDANRGTIGAGGITQADSGIADGGGIMLDQKSISAQPQSTDTFVLSSLSSPLSKMSRPCSRNPKERGMTKAVSYGSFPYQPGAPPIKEATRHSPTTHPTNAPQDAYRGTPATATTVIAAAPLRAEENNNNNYPLPRSHSIEDLAEHQQNQQPESQCTVQ